MGLEIHIDGLIAGKRVQSPVLFGQASVYLCLPATRMGACSRWLRIFINQLDRVGVMREGEVAPEQQQHGLTGRTEVTELHELLTLDEVSRLFARSDPFKRQLVIWAGYDPMILQRVEYFDRESAHYPVFARVPGSA